MRHLKLTLIILAILTTTAAPAAAQGFLELWAGTYQEHHPYLEYRGEWEAVTNDDYIEDTAIFTTDPNAWVRFTARGAAVTLYRTVGPGYGSFEVCINEDPCTTVSNESAITTNHMPVVLYSESYAEETPTFTLRAAGGTLNIDQIKVDRSPTDWPIPTPWPTPDATPFMNTWDEGTELALHMVNGWIWINQAGLGSDNNRIQIFDMLAFGLMMGAIFLVLASAIQRATGGGRKGK